MVASLKSLNLLGPTSRRRAVPIKPMQPRDLKRLGPKWSARDKAWLKANDFTGTAGQVLTMPTEKGEAAEVLWGIGDEREGLKDLFAAAALPQKLPPGAYEIAASLKKVEAERLALGWALEAYRFSRYRQNATTQSCWLKLPRNVKSKRIRILAGAIYLTRDLVNTPADDMGPAELEQAARQVGRANKARIAVVRGKELTEKFPAVYAVGRAADKAPRLIDLTWGRKNAPKVTLVGKGVCFDSGGLDIKPAAGMRFMKKDMGGGAVALGLAQAIMEAGLDIRLRVIVPAVENAVSGNAIRPGDIIGTRKGLSVEIGNTDAEGRLILADGLALAAEEKPELLIDFATLTGAARVALGADLPALYASDDKLAQGLVAAGAKTADPAWHMPLWQPYAEGLSSQIADLQNVTDNGLAGSITAALFLKRFAEGAGKWAHFDLFAWNQKPRPGRPPGGEAQCLRAVFEFLEDFAG